MVKQPMPMATKFKSTRKKKFDELQNKQALQVGRVRESYLRKRIWKWIIPQHPSSRWLKMQTRHFINGAKVSTIDHTGILMGRWSGLSRLLWSYRRPPCTPRDKLHDGVSSIRCRTLPTAHSEAIAAGYEELIVSRKMRCGISFHGEIQYSIE